MDLAPELKKHSLTKLSELLTVLAPTRDVLRMMKKLGALFPHVLGRGAERPPNEPIERAGRTKAEQPRDFFHKHVWPTAQQGGRPLPADLCPPDRRSQAGLLSDNSRQAARVHREDSSELEQRQARLLIEQGVGALEQALSGRPVSGEVDIDCLTKRVEPQGFFDIGDNTGPVALEGVRRRAVA